MTEAKLKRDVRISKFMCWFMAAIFAASVVAALYFTALAGGPKQIEINLWMATMTLISFAFLCCALTLAVLITALFLWQRQAECTLMVLEKLEGLRKNDQ